MSGAAATPGRPVRQMPRPSGAEDSGAASRGLSYKRRVRRGLLCEACLRAPPPGPGFLGEENAL